MNTLVKSVLFLKLLSLACPLMAGNSIPVTNNQKIGFLGDSITEQGAAASGYVNLVIMGLKAVGIEATAIPAGVSGNTAGSMHSRLGPHVLDTGADWMTLSCGVNDVRLSNEGRAGGIEEFKTNVTDIVDHALAKNVKAILLTTTPLGEELDNDRDKQIGPYNDFLRAYAKEKQLILADINAALREALAKPLSEGQKEGKRLLADGTHPNQEGQTLRAMTVLKALGVAEEDFGKIETEWLENPRGKGVKAPKGTHALISTKQYAAMGKGIGETDPEKADEAAQQKIGTLVDEFLKSKPTNP